METPYLISSLEAKRIIQENTPLLKPVLLDLDRADFHVLSEDIWAPWNIPSFRQSSVDGYALRYDDYTLKNLFFLEGESAAGNSDYHVLKPQQAERIFTGAPIPEGADTMIMQEKVRILDGFLKIESHNFQKGDHVREIGSEIRSGELAIKKGTRLSPSSLGFLANIGISRVWVYPMPRIGIFLTGNELQEPGNVLKSGKVFESNSYSLNSALKSFHFPKAEVIWVKDNLVEMMEVLKDFQDKFDLLLFTGGVSVGDYDFTPKALKQSGFETLFYKIRQRPGKPLLFAKKDSILAFGLPGNPASVLTCFYQYVVLALENQTGMASLLTQERACLGINFRKIPGLTFFTRGNIHNGKVYPLSGQESYKMASYSEANCLMEMEEDREDFFEGEELNIYRIP